MVEFNTTVTNIDQSTDTSSPVIIQRTSTTDGSVLPEVEASLVVVADGYRSTLRNVVCDGVVGL